MQEFVRVTSTCAPTMFITPLERSGDWAPHIHADPNCEVGGDTRSEPADPLSALHGLQGWPAPDISLL
ncbi:hypothetical protein ACJZ2D_005974 [Fusarium nematophilum]